MEEFNGIISLLIVCIELLLLINLIIFSKKNEVNRIAIAMILLLLLYQLMEFLICYLELQYYFMIYLAFVFITLLPPLGLNFISRFSNKYNNYSKIIFLPALFFIVYYIFVIDNFRVSNCNWLFAIYDYPLGTLYGFSCFIIIILTIITLVISYRREKQKKRRSMFRVLLLGYILTFIPAFILIILFPQLLNALESILSKFAFIFTVTLTLFALKNNENNHGEPNA